jgi:hypothetical protein
MEKDSSGGTSLCEGFHEGDLEGGLIYWGTRKIRFVRNMQNALQTGVPLHRGSVGEPGGGSFAGTFERKKYIWVPFLDPEVIKIISLRP